ncbi:hypothetical protein D9619_013370 [Psilocybe cf. subviscida]|uniref:BTB domain-containing protein n=1 Tax=Psilocybe cf. subviscida TaxID=2480587 RepID=A0A8H5F937_9AGAR|nr:hypothetical protein D9619_013370 [Psilocybe cf. subviscida]
MSQSASSSQSFHPNFNIDVLPVIFMVDTTLFKIDASRLSNHCTLLKNMLFDSKEIGLSAEGSSVEQPIIIPDCTADVFANFCGWLYQVGWHEDPAEHAQQLIDVLHVCHRYDISAGIKLASEELLRPRFNLVPSRRLSLALCYGLQSWINDAVRALIALPPRSYTPTDLNYLGAPIYHLLFTAKDNILVERQKVANFPCYPRNGDASPWCADHEQCEQVWTCKWLTVIAREIHNTVTPLELADIPHRLHIADHAGVTPECKSAFLEYINSLPQLRKEEELTVQVVEAITAFCN